MCVVSMISDFGRDWTKQSGWTAPTPGTGSLPVTVPPMTPTYTGIFWNAEMLTEFLDLIRRVKKLEDGHSVETCFDEKKLADLTALAKSFKLHDSGGEEYDCCNHCGLKRDYWKGECPALSQS